MATVGPRDQDRLEGSLKTYAKSVLAVPQDVDQQKYKKEMAKAKRMILDGVQGHLVSHVAKKGKRPRRCEMLSLHCFRVLSKLKMYL